MDPKSIRRVALADVDETVLRDLIDHGEDLYVERKQQPPATEALGAEVASMANMLGGWLLIGVANDKRLVGWQPEKATSNPTSATYCGRPLIRCNWARMRATLNRPRRPMRHALGGGVLRDASTEVAGSKPAAGTPLLSV